MQELCDSLFTHFLTHNDELTLRNISLAGSYLQKFLCELEESGIPFVDLLHASVFDSRLCNLVSSSWLYVPLTHLHLKFIFLLLTLLLTILLPVLL